MSPDGPRRKEAKMFDKLIENYTEAAESLAEAGLLWL